MIGLPQVFGAAHHCVENLVVVLTAAQISGNSMRQFLACGIWICFQESDGGHHEAGHAERALETLLVNHALLNGMESSVSVGKSFDGDNFSRAYGVRQHGAGIMGDVVDEHC